MIGSESFTVLRPATFLYSGLSGSNKTPTAQPPSSGCYLRAEGVGTIGTITIIGVVGGAPTTEVMSTFDSEKVGVNAKLFTSITTFSITGFTSVIIYPATASGDKINLPSSSYTTFNILADSYDTNLNQYRGQYIDFAGTTYKVYKTLMLDGRFTLLPGDLITIGGKQLKVADVEPQHGLYSALLIIWR